jgi:hypothetical protein
MENQELYIEDIIKEYLNQTADTYNLDLVTISSLARSCIELDSTELPRSSMIVRDIKDRNKSHSIKFRNIRFNFKFGLSIIFGVKNVFTSEGASLVLVLLDLIQKFISEAHISLNNVHTFLVYTIHTLDYNNKGVELEKIFEYSKNNGPDDMRRLELDIKKIEEELTSLEKLDCIVMENGRYKLREVIIG